MTLRTCDWFAVAAGKPPPPPDPEPAVAVADRTALERAWAIVHREVEFAMDRGEIPGDGFVWAPHLSVLTERIIRQWAALSTPEVFGSCVDIVRKLHERPDGAILGYEYLKIAYNMAGDTERAEMVADLLQRYLKRQELSFRAVRPEDLEHDDDEEPGGVSRAS